KTGTTDNHADAWFDGFTRQLSTVVWMGYPKGEIPMLDVHGEAVAGATFPVPIWHEYMAAALYHRKALDFLLPNKYPSYHYLQKGDYGSLAYVAPATTTTATTTTTPARTKTTKVTTQPTKTETKHTPPPPPATTTVETPPPETTTVETPP